MVYIDDNFNITMTRGDTFVKTISLTQNGEPYTPRTGDVIRFAMSKVYKGKNGYELLLNKVIDNDTLLWVIDAEDTADLPYGKYVYDLQITYGDTGIYIKNSNYALILAVITCNGTKTNASDWGGISICIGTRYASNGNFITAGQANAQMRDYTLFWSEMTDNGFSSNVGVYSTTNQSTFKFLRKAHASSCPKVMAGTYTVKVYGLTAL